LRQTNESYTAILSCKNDQLIGCLTWNEFLFNLVYWCDIFVKLTKLIISAQGPDKSTLDL